MSLVSTSFAKSILLSPFPGIQFCEYLGSAGDYQRFRCLRENEEFFMLTALLLRKEEELLWKSYDEILSRTLKEAAASLQGFFGFELLSVELGESIRSFQWDHLRQLVINHARTLKIGEEKLIQYTSLFGILKKRIPETWGKIESQSRVKIYRSPGEELDLFVKKMLRTAEPLAGKHEIVLNDLSETPLFRFGEENQTSRLEKLLKATKAKKELPPIYILDARGMTELGEQFGMRENV